MSKQDTKQADVPASEFGSVIDSELAVLASIEARYWDDLSKLELSAIPSSLKEHLRAQLEEKRRMAREPHVLRLARLHEEATIRSLFSPKTKH